MAVNRVQELLERVTRALDAAGLDYAIIGGNAVAAWVSTIDPDAIRTTKDVDLLVRRSDLDRIAAALRPLGLVLAEVLGVSMFVDANDSSPRTGVHLLFANEPVRPDDAVRAPDVEQAKPGVLGFRVIPLMELVKMKLLAFRLRDQVHLVDMLSVGLIDASWKARLPAELQDRFQQVLEAFEREEGHG
ncbi:MAG TPA: hypothetical protein VM487_09125 [Phycisphaerae bacterium]|nr:hypothetical protein [Phycisphaerae bacterium]